MRFQNTIDPTIIRPPYYYQAFSHNAVYYNALGVAPHSETVRASYTIGGGRRAFLEHVYLMMQRSSLSTNSERVGMRVYISHAGGPFQIVAELARVMNLLYDTHELGLRLGILLGGGDVVRLTTYDLNAAGSVNYVGYVSITEFDIS